jgi:hypothetical protein
MVEGVSNFSIWDLGDGMLHEKGVSNVGFHSFQPFNLLLQMLVVTKAYLPILISNYIFPNKEGLERVDKFVPNKKSISEKVPNFQDTHKEDVQIVAPFKPNKFQL